MLRAQITAVHTPLNFYLKHTMEYMVYIFVYFLKFILNMYIAFYGITFYVSAFPKYILLYVCVLEMVKITQCKFLQFLISTVLN